MLYTINIYDILTTKIQCVCAHAHTQHTLPFAAHGTGTIPNRYIYFTAMGTILKLNYN